MRVLYLSYSNCIGGAELSLLSMVQEMKNRGHKVFLAMPYNTDTTYYKLISPFCEEVIFLNWTPWSVFSSSQLMARLKNYLYQIYVSGGHLGVIYKLVRIIRKRKIDLIHTNNTAVLQGGLAAKYCGKPHFWHIRELFNEAENAIVKYRFSKNAERVRSIFSGLSSKIIVNSNFTFTSHKAYFDPEKVEVVYNGLEEEWFNSEIQLPKTPFRIGVVGNLTSRVKNHEFAISILAILLKEHWKSYELHLYGYVPEDSDPYLTSLRNMISKKGIQSRVYMHGSTPVSKIYSEIDVLLHPSKVETFGRIYIEAMASRVPVLAYEGGAASEVIENGVSGYLTTDADTAAQRINELCKDKDLYTRITEAGYKRAREKFRLTDQMDKLERLYKEAI
ncbi:MAG: glycosyltransferase family 4 protein [Owenweeksia sp.]